jgi:hypothetical protein
VLLDVCKESRAITIKNYQALFKAPPPPPLIWRYNGSPKSVDLREHLKRLGLRQTGTVESMPRVLASYMNENPTEIAKFQWFGELKEGPPSHLLCPRWFNPAKDTLLLNTPDKYWRYDRMLWSPFRSETLQIRFIAFELDHFFRIHPSHGKKRSWNNRILRRPGSISPPIRFDRLADGSLECIALICKEDCEVITIQLDETGKLAPDQWAYQYDTKCQEHKERFTDHKWSNVTWRVFLGKRPGVKLWDRAAAWKLDNTIWQREKRKLLLVHPDVYIEWHLAQRFHVPPPPQLPVEPTLLPGGDGATWLGPVRS